MLYWGEGSKQRNSVIFTNSDAGMVAYFLRFPAPSIRSKHTINTHSRASQRKRLTLPYGTGRLVLCSTFVIQSIYGSIQHYTGYERPEWLDPEATRQMDGAGLEPATPSL